MRIATARIDGREEAVVMAARGAVPVRWINARLGRAWPTTVIGLIEDGLSLHLAEDAERLKEALNPATLSFGPLYRHPRKIWGIGLNYMEHAKDLAAAAPTEPASFVKCDQTIIGPGDTILLPPESQRVTGEAELGVIIGRTCRNVSEAGALEYVAGVCLVIDMTAEDILQRNPRFLTRAKNFDTFFSFGPELVTLDEIPDLSGTVVGTYKNGKLHRENVVANMAFSPSYLVSFHSQMGTFYPGDIISTGTPGAAVIEDGDLAECRIAGMGSLTNPVHRVVR